MIGALTILSRFKIDGKYWLSARKKFDQKFAMWGFTGRGRSLSRNASETLEALLKYMGLIIVDRDKCIHITPAGNALPREFPIKEPRRKKMRLKETEKQMGDITSDILKTQMMKLVLTNPSIKAYCQSVLIMPFRETLLMLNELSYLTQEEIAMFLFHMRNKSQRNQVKNKIRFFRRLSERKQKERIKKYLQTPEGNLTLKQAPTATYWIQLCRNTGLCEKENKKLVIKKKRINEVKRLLEKYLPDEEYDFKDNLDLWHSYFTDNKIIEAPFDIVISLSYKNKSKFLIAVSRGEATVCCGVLPRSGSFGVPVFLQQIYRIDLVNLDTGEYIGPIFKKFGKRDRKITIKVPPILARDFDYYAGIIKELISSKDFDPQYKKQLIDIGRIIPKDYSKDLLSKKRRGWLRGGRLEFLFYKLLETAEREGVIKELKWNGKVSKFGIAQPAPAGKKGNPDATFKVKDITLLLELTTIPSASAQWTAEGSSVPYHVANFVKEKGNTNVYGVFSAPIMHERVVNSLKSALMPARCKILCLSIEDFIRLLADKKQIYQKVKNLIRKEYP